MNEGNNASLEAAIKDGDAEGVLSSIRNGDNPKAHRSRSLFLAVRYGRTDIVRMLIPLTHPTENNSWALRTAAENFDTELVLLLLPVSDPTIAESVLAEYHQSGALFLNNVIRQYAQAERLRNDHMDDLFNPPSKQRATL